LIIKILKIVAMHSESVFPKEAYTLNNAGLF